MSSRQYLQSKFPTARLVHIRSGKVIAEHMPVARTILQQSIGLLCVWSASALPGMIFPGVRSIHTFGMVFSLDIIFIDQDNRCVGLRKNVPSFRCILGPPEVKATIELPAGEIDKIGGVNIGDVFGIAEN